MKFAFFLPLALVIFICPVPVFAQTKVVTIKCGEEIKREFSVNKEVHEIKLKLEANSSLSLSAVPVGDFLNIRVEIFDPSGSMIFPANPQESKIANKMFLKNPPRSLEVSLGVFSANGLYTIKIHNAMKYRNDGRAGEYSFIAECRRN